MLSQYQRQVGSKKLFKGRELLAQVIKESYSDGLLVQPQSPKLAAFLPRRIAFQEIEGSLANSVESAVSKYLDTSMSLQDLWAQEYQQLVEVEVARKALQFSFRKVQLSTVSLEIKEAQRTIIPSDLK
jgi:hypothetical protein